MYHPEAQSLALIRKDIDRNPQRLKRVITDDILSNEFLFDEEDNRLPKDGSKMSSIRSGRSHHGDEDRDNQVIKRFIKRNSENALKTAPKGFPKDHENIALLRLRDFTVGRRLTDAEVMSANAAEKIANIFGAMVPLINYLNDVVMPDLNAPTSVVVPA